MNKNINVTLYKGSEPLLVATDLHKEIKAALQTKVNLPSGGYLFIQTTEALTVIDVNSGKFTNSATQDETILKTNIEAVHEIARQLRLRNIGGMIIIDFIDMISRADKLAMMEELEIALEPDKAKPQVGQLSDLGLVELTRHRQGQSLSEIFTKKCPHCQGSGYSMVEFNFATPTAEGEYRAKAAKLKLPTGNFKKNNNNNKQNNNKQQEAQVQEQPQRVPR
jgi:ribonuclease E